MPDEKVGFGIPADLVRFKYPLPRLAQALKGNAEIKIVAIGSSSTAGEGGILPYPSMQHWHESDDIPFAQMIDPTDGDQLHQSDWSTNGVAQALTGAIVDAAGLAGGPILAGIPR
jgi:hypothetical protein